MRFVKHHDPEWLLERAREVRECLDREMPLLLSLADALDARGGEPMTGDEVEAHVREFRLATRRPTPTAIVQPSKPKANRLPRPTDVKATQRSRFERWMHVRAEEGRNRP